MDKMALSSTYSAIIIIVILAGQRNKYCKGWGKGYPLPPWEMLVEILAIEKCVSPKRTLMTISGEVGYKNKKIGGIKKRFNL